ncbi:MAG: hypothetical protein EPO20_14675 [Betaproteobacteria bacterium]|nr:MAG: hypothetical protein EPO20_14675 [Betaproteobacteria bacterium]
MGRGDKKIHPLAEPLFKRIGKKGGAAGFATKLNVSEQVVSNWKRRGVPALEVPRVAAELGMTTEQYLAEAGYPRVQKAEQPATQYTFEASTLMEDFLALPDGLREYVSRKAAELRAYADALPAFIRDALKPPTDPERYRAWERDIEADMTRRRLEEKPPEPEGEQRRRKPLGDYRGAPIESRARDVKKPRKG